jgi:RNA polymerase sigma factor (sigma-70 family)
MAAAQAGDRAAYETLLQDCIPFIKMVARRRGVSFDRIDDVVQDTLLTVHRARQTYDPSRSFAAWLRTIAQRRAIDGLRRHNRHQSREIYAPLAYENQAPINRTGLVCLAAPWRSCLPGNLRPCSIWHCRDYRSPKPQRQPDGRWGHSR